MPDDMTEKLIFQIPPTRVDEPMYIALAQQAAHEDRSMSYIVRKALAAYLVAHDRTVEQSHEGDK